VRAGAIVGYSGDGVQRAAPATIAEIQAATGPNIYHDVRVHRQIFRVQGQVVPGESGAPLLTDQGAVVGMMFAADLDDEGTSYALTARELATGARDGQTATSAVATRGCAD
jgi:hypothetical protein